MTKYKLPSQQGAATAIGPPASALPLALLASALLALSGCASTPPPTVDHAPPPVAVVPPPPAPAPAPAPVAPPAPPTPVAFETAIVNAATTLFKNASANVAGPRVVVIDPLVDAVSGQQNVASRHIEKRLREIVREQFPAFEVREFSSANVAKAPIVLVGTFTGIQLDNTTVGVPQAYRICFALADLAADKIVAKSVARAIPEGINTTPTPYFADTPVWVKDAAVDAYIKTCQGTKLGDPIDPVYRERIDAATLVSDAILAYEKRDFRRALDLYGRAVRSAAGDQLRVHSGLYLANWKLGKRADAEKAFGHIVDNGIANNKLAVKLLFQPGKTDFWADKQVSGPYPIWLRQIASKLAKTDRCLNVIGHTSRSGPEPVNERLSLARAQNIKWRLESVTPNLVSRVKATGMGFRENVVGTGSDDLSDLQDRRVEFKIGACGA